ncbi:hypothetical protein [Halodurantibacterium flavum]|uniref:Uncharacterized protein n=1 Tax=Halodurantibacterium flavum TaxID=1382802 RepID=A0ABW4S9B6_9RHOB
MPNFRRLLSRMLKPGKRLKIKRRVPSLSTLLARFAEQSKFLRTAPPPVPKPESRPPPDRPPPLKPRFRKPAGPKM